MDRRPRTAAGVFQSVLPFYFEWEIHALFLASVLLKTDDNLFPGGRILGQAVQIGLCGEVSRGEARRVEGSNFANVDQVQRCDHDVLARIYEVGCETLVHGHPSWARLGN